LQRRESARRHIRAGLVLALAGIVAIGAMAVYRQIGTRVVLDSRPVASRAPAQGWLSFRGNHLVYGHDQQGNRIPDFSYAGYEGGGVALPVVPARVTLSAPAGDATATIQQAIDQVSAMPRDRSGFRGAVVLNPGTYRIGTSLHIGASGVVLRGASANPADTVLLPTNPVARTLVNIAGSGIVTPTGPSHKVTDGYVPVGASTLTLDSTAGLAIGDTVIVQRPQTQAWIHAIGMDSIPPRPDGKPITQWPPNAGLQFERTIVAIHGPHIVLDVPLTNALERQFTDATVWKYSFTGRIGQVGLENLSSDGAAMAADPSVTNGSGFFDVTFVNLDAVENAWVRNTVVTRYTQPYQVGTGAIRVTILHTQSHRVAASG